LKKDVQRIADGVVPHEENGVVVVGGDGGGGGENQRIGIVPCELGQRRNSGCDDDDENRSQVSSMSGTTLKTADWHHAPPAPDTTSISSESTLKTCPVLPDGLLHQTRGRRECKDYRPLHEDDVLDQEPKSTDSQKSGYRWQSLKPLVSSNALEKVSPVENSWPESGGESVSLLQSSANAGGCSSSEIVKEPTEHCEGADCNCSNCQKSSSQQTGSEPMTENENGERDNGTEHENNALDIGTEDVDPNLMLDRLKDS
jgi:hypothetical protein